MCSSRSCAACPTAPQIEGVQPVVVADAGVPSLLVTAKIVGAVACRHHLTDSDRKTRVHNQYDHDNHCEMG
jgi:hypothetical protein